MFHRYQECLVLLATELIKKIRFAFNGGDLIAFDNVERGDNSMTEWQEHVLNCTDVVIQIAKLFPEHIVAAVMPELITHLDMFTQLHEGVNIKQTPGQPPQLEFPSEDVKNKVYGAFMRQNFGIHP